MRVFECGPRDACPCGNDAMPRFADCCLSRPWERRDIIPNQTEEDGSIVHAFSVFRKDETAAIIFPQTTFTFFVHPALDMVALDAFLTSGKPRTAPPPELEHPLARLQELCGGFPDDRVLMLSNGRSGAYNFQGNEADVLHILSRVWHYEPTGAAPARPPAAVEQLPEVTGKCDCGVEAKYGTYCEICSEYHTQG